MQNIFASYKEGKINTHTHTLINKQKNLYNRDIINNKAKNLFGEGIHSIYYSYYKKQRTQLSTVEVNIQIFQISHEKAGHMI